MDLAFEEVTLGSLHLESSFSQLTKAFFKMEQVFILTVAKNDYIIKILLCCSNVVQVPLSLNPFQLNLEFGTTLHPRYTKSNQIYNKSQN